MLFIVKFAWDMTTTSMSPQSSWEVSTDINYKTHSRTHFLVASAGSSFLSWVLILELVWCVVKGERLQQWQGASLRGSVGP